jgi:glycosyltransferase involved in cell wall biosynthesis
MDYHRLIFIDSGSTDGTLEIAERYGEVYRGSWNLAEGRTYAVKLVDCPFFAFIDSDIYISKDWFRRIMSQFTPEVGAVQGRPLPLNPFLKSYSEAHHRLQSFLGRERRRGGTHNTVIRTEAVRGIEIPPSYRIGEDWYIKRFIEKRGYRWIYDPTITVDHESSERFAGSSLIKHEDTYRELVMLGFISKREVIGQFLSAPMIGFLLTLIGRNPKLLSYHLMTKYHYLKGALQV